ncbi:Rrf2 family transcriptional regulator [Palaeococcus ferrophilus]|uniref:Rrf2 family transcriptional regulator n=1 Tax=Palaeococcus ferrophilus TaxID=83868 RepID=UPI00064ED372|nr:Rrf2 family transcriptional regulator [Palaeococcus ferrophilus]
MPQKEVVYNLLAVKKRAVALQKLSEELDTPMPHLFKTLKSLESEGLVEVYYGKEKAQVMVRAKTIEDFML